MKTRFTLIEMLATLGLVSIGILSLFVVQAVTIKQHKAATEYLIAREALLSALELSIQSKSYDSKILGSLLPNAIWKETRNPSNEAVQLEELTICVSWKNGRSLEMTCLIPAKGEQ